MAHQLQRSVLMDSTRLLRPAAMACLALVLSVAPTAAVTPDELAALSKAGLGDEVLLALIDASGLSAVVDATAALQLKRQGVSDRVIAAAVRASAPPPAVEAAADPCWSCEVAAPVYQPLPEAPAVVERQIHREVIYVPWILAPSRPGPAPKPQPYLRGNRGVGRFINDGVSLPRDTRPTARR